MFSLVFWQVPAISKSDFSPGKKWNTVHTTQLNNRKLTIYFFKQDESLRGIHMKSIVGVADGKNLKKELVEICKYNETKGKMLTKGSRSLCILEFSVNKKPTKHGVFFSVIKSKKGSALVKNTIIFNGEQKMLQKYNKDIDQLLRRFL